jgi:hypothetical protein
MAITCMETLEHLSSFNGLVEWLSDRSEAGADVLLSVPNDAFWALENPYHATAWGEGAFAELCSLLPAYTTAAQFPLNGSWIAPDGVEPDAVEIGVTAGEARVPSHFLVALGPNRDRLAPAAAATRTDLAERRRWERQRDASLAWLEARVEALDYLADQNPLRSSTDT